MFAQCADKVLQHFGRTLPNTTAYMRTGVAGQVKELAKGQYEWVETGRLALSVSLRHQLQGRAAETEEVELGPYDEIDGMEWKRLADWIDEIKFVTR